VSLLPWWQRDPERLEREERALREAGIEFTRDEDAAGGGVLALNVSVSGPDEAPAALRAIYPDTFPYFKPAVFGPPMGLTHHHNPVSGELCLLETGQGVWQTDDTLAYLLTTQWKKLLDANANDGRDSDGCQVETKQAEPVTVYLDYEPAYVVALDGTLALPTGMARGTMAVAFQCMEPLKGFVRSAFSPSGEQFFTGGPLYLGDCPVLAARWVLLPDVPDSFDAESLWKAAVAVDSGVKDHWVPVPRDTHTSKGPAGPRQIQLVLVGLPEEISHRQLGIGWLALTRYRPSRGKPPGKFRIARVIRGGPMDLFERAPELEGLAGKHVVVVGGGGLGSAIITELGRVGLGTLSIIDGDFVDLAAAVRFPSATRFAGGRKVDALRSLVNESNPYTCVFQLDGIVGSTRAGLKDTDQLEVLLGQIASADLVIDATADVSIQRFLFDTAHQNGVAYLHAEATHGVWGGLIAIYGAQDEFCWTCLQHYLADGTVPSLPVSAEEPVQPPGCFEPTYTGTGFDLAVIASNAVRVAVSHLTGKSGYGVMLGNVHTVGLRDQDGQPVPPSWVVYQFDPHPECRAHE
jgi:hypothetical protein